MDAEQRLLMGLTETDELLLKKALNGGTAWLSKNTEEEARLLAVILHHRIQPLLYEKLQETGYLKYWPDSIQSALLQASRAQAMANAMLQVELTQVLSALAEAGIFPLLMKGLPLSYTHYTSPHLRPHGDVDLLIRRQDLAASESVMRRLGYHRYPNVRGELVSHQVLYRKQHSHRISYDFDFHWKVCNPHLFAGFIAHQELEERAMKVPALGEHARALGPVDALLLACVHRVAHHNNDHRLIWLYDIHLLASAMSRKEFEEFAGLAVEKKMTAICLAGLNLAKDWFDTKLPTQEWPDGKNHELTERSAKYLTPQLRRLDLLKLDLSNLHGWHKLQLLREHLFPPAHYMFHRYSVSNRFLLPVLYFHRAAAGMWNWIGRS